MFNKPYSRSRKEHHIQFSTRVPSYSYDGTRVVEVGDFDLVGLINSGSFGNLSNILNRFKLTGELDVTPSEFAAAGPCLDYTDSPPTDTRDINAMHAWRVRAQQATARSKDHLATLASKIEASQNDSSPEVKDEI